jgi:hypothetical protein
MASSGPVVEPTPDSRLDGLLARYESLKAAAEEANERFEACKDAIKAEISGQHPEARRVVIKSGALNAPLELVAVEQMRLDTKKFKAENPLQYCAYTYKSTSWQLRKAK